MYKAFWQLLGATDGSFELSYFWRHMCEQRHVIQLLPLQLLPCQEF